MNPMMERRAFLALSLPAMAAPFALAAPTPPAEPLTADAALAKLKLGNMRFVASKPIHPHQGSARRIKLSAGQHPFAAILSCADSRVPPELLFDEGLGDLFVVRIAGNVVDDAIIGSLEYGAHHLEIPLLVVLGHASCGAVTAAVNGGEVEDHVKSLIAAIHPAVEKARPMSGDLTANAISVNVEQSVDLLARSTPTLAARIAEHKLKVVGAIYDLATGKVTWLKPAIIS